MIKRFNIALNNEDASLSMEMIALISTIFIICTFLLAFMYVLLDVGETRSDTTRSIGWFRSGSTNGLYKEGDIVQ